MIYKTELIYSAEEAENIMSDFSVKLHGMLMNIIPHEYARRLHKTELQPFSVSCVRHSDLICATVTALSSEAAVLCRAASECRQPVIYGADGEIRLLSSHYSNEIELDTLVNRYDNADLLRLNINSPAMIKLSGIASCPPNLKRYYRSVIKKYNCFENGSVDFNSFGDIFDALKITSLSLDSTEFNKSGNIIHGLMGYVDIPLPKNKDHAELLKTMLVYSTCCGIGAKSALGMGSVTLEIL